MSLRRAIGHYWHKHTYRREDSPGVKPPGSRTFDGRLQLLEYLPTVLDAPPGVGD